MLTQASFIKVWPTYTDPHDRGMQYTTPHPACTEQKNLCALSGTRPAFMFASPLLCGGVEKSHLSVVPARFILQATRRVVKGCVFTPRVGNIKRSFRVGRLGPDSVMVPFLNLSIASMKIQRKGYRRSATCSCHHIA